ncbi:MAG: TrmH family RNA methyltransferase [Acidobacteriota bacterium]
MPSDRTSVIGRSNPLVAQVRLLSRSPRERHRRGLIVVEGIRLAEEALAAGVPVQAAVISPKLLQARRGRRLRDLLKAAGISTRRASDSLLASLHDADTHQGILLLARWPGGSSKDSISSGAGCPVVLVAHGIQDPGNIGALVRVADASGAGAFMALGGADPFGPKALRASAGSVFRLPVLREPSLAAASTRLAELRERGFRLVGAVPRGGIDYRDADLSAPMALLMGGEGAGLPPALQAGLDMEITIPLRSRVESINVVAAASVLLFEATRRRDHRTASR